MTLNPFTTDQMLAALDELQPHAECEGACDTEVASQTVAKTLTQVLPGVDPKVIGEISLHIGNEINNVIMSGRAAGNDWQKCAATAVVVALETGALLYRGQATS